MDNKDNLKNYIYQQIQAGLSPNEIKSQLVGAGWSEAQIKAGFDEVQNLVVPSPVSKPSDSPTTATIQVNGKKRGRLKTSWILLKQSLKVLKHNKGLIRYPLMSGVITILIGIVFGIIYFLAKGSLLVTTIDSYGQSKTDLTALGIGVSVVYYVLTYFVIFLYNAGLAAHVLDIFKGKSGDYKQYMQVAWSKKMPILAYSIITTTVGYLLRAIEERFKIIGWIVSRFFGVLWALANLFTIPIIVENDISAPEAIRKSASLFKSRWGENIAARISFGFVAFLFYLLIAVPVFIFLAFLLSQLGGGGILFFLFLLIVAFLTFAVIETAASNILSTSLYYYAQYNQIPPAFDAELLNSVFIAKKKKGGLFRKSKV